MGQALYRKYRSKTFDEVIGQQHITKTLNEAIKSGRISHAYLFTGPRGVGKTSVARILAHEVNELKNSGEPSHMDIIEIDAASNRRIDEIRDLRERVHIAPAGSKYKVYIIDEVHMLTKEAFNALLKTLEEPPAHVIFILATTEAHKLPETIISRTQRFSFKPVDSQALATHLEQLAKKEKLQTTKEALQMIADYSEGSVRDSVGLLDQLAASGKKIDEDAVRQMLGVPKSRSMQKLIELVDEGASADIMATLDELQNQGVSPSIAAKELSNELRQLLVSGDGKDWMTKLLRSLLDVGASDHPQDSLEISLLEAASQVYVLKKEPVKRASAKSVEPESITLTKSPINPAAFSIDMWSELLTNIKKSGSSCYSALRLAKPDVSEGIITLFFEFLLHQKKVDQVKTKEEIAQAVENLCGQRLKIECVVDKSKFNEKKFSAVSAKMSQEKPDKDPVKTINNIFGAAEVLES